LMGEMRKARVHRLPEDPGSRAAQLFQRYYQILCSNPVELILL
jgi:hypothetical protein